MLFDPADINKVRHLIEQQAPGPQQQVEFHKLNTMAAFAEAQTCRRQVLLHYFDESSSKPCGNCDICLDPPQKYDGTEDAKKCFRAFTALTKVSVLTISLKCFVAQKRQQQCSIEIMKNYLHGELGKIKAMSIG